MFGLIFIVAVLLTPQLAGCLTKKVVYWFFFESYKKSLSNNLKVYTHLFYSNELGEPEQLKNSRLQSIECAYETWNELISGGWQVVANKFQ